MPFRLGNPQKLHLSRNHITCEQDFHVFDDGVSPRMIFSAEWFIPYIMPPQEPTPNHLRINAKLYIARQTISWFVSQTSNSHHETLPYADDLTSRSMPYIHGLGVMRPDSVLIRGGCLWLSWTRSRPQVEGRIKSLYFHNNGGITETLNDLDNYFPPDQIQNSQSYHLFPWFNDVYYRMDIFSCGLAPHTVSIYGKDYAVVIRFCHTRHIKDMLRESRRHRILPLPQERQTYIRIDPNRTDQYDVSKKYPVYFQLVPLCE
jgi:hypothetical protein